MNWTNLESEEQLHGIVADGQPALIFKHSTRCGVSSRVKRNVEMDASEIPADVPIYYLDLIRYRNVSSEVARMWNVRHESPQLLLVRGTACLYHASHSDVDLPEALTVLGQN